MKRYRPIYIAIMLAVTVCRSGSCLAQSYIGAAIAGDVPMTLDRTDFTHIRPSYGAGIGAVYEWHWQQLFVQTGIQYAFDCPAVGLDNVEMEQNMIDTRDVAFVYRGTLKDRTDQIQTGQLTIPLYIGAEWKGVYAMAGVKAVLHLHSSSTMHAQLKTVGDYGSRYFEPIENEPNHGYHDFLPVTVTKPIRLRMYDLRVGGEIGYTLHLEGDEEIKPSIRIGAFTEYGLMDMMESISGAPCLRPDYTQYLQVDMTHAYDSFEGTEAQPHMLICGLRVTVLFQVGPSKPVPAKRHCMCLQ